MLLQDKLDALKAECLAKTPPKVTLVRQRAVEGLAGLAERAMHAGEQAPAFQLRDSYGGVFSSREALRRGPIILVFYRGRWCPYCNIDLRAIEAASHDIRSLGASLVVVSRRRLTTAGRRRRATGFRSRAWSTREARSRSLSACAGRSPTNCVLSRRTAEWISRPSTAIRAGRWPCRPGTLWRPAG